MPDFGITFFACAIVAVLFAGASKGGFGSGASFASAPILALVVDPAVALGMLLPLLMLMDVGGLRAYWRAWDMESARPIVLGAMPGVLLGVLFYKLADPDLLRLLIGVIAVAFVIYQLCLTQGLLRIKAQKMGIRAGGIAGVFAGFTSFVSHAGGPPVAIYLLSRQLDKTRFQATTVLVFWLINIMKFIPYAVIGVFNRDTWLADLYLAPVALLGVWIGVVAHKHVPDRAYFAITYALLLITGGKLIFDGLT